MHAVKKKSDKITLNRFAIKGAAKTLKQVAAINYTSIFTILNSNMFRRSMNVFYNGRFIINTTYMYPAICLNIEYAVYLILKMKPEAL